MTSNPPNPDKTSSGDCPVLLELPQFKGNRRSWHINKSIDLGNLLVMVGMLVGTIVYVLTRMGGQDIKINSVEEGLKSEHAVNVQQDELARRNDDRVNQKLDKLDDKLSQVLGQRTR